MAKVENFSPYLLSLAQRAMLERQLIPVPNWSDAKRLQARFNKLRVAMRNENHVQLPLIERVTSRTSKRQDASHWVAFEPVDADLEELIKKAGIEPIAWNE
jgi:hypothetical protein